MDRFGPAWAGMDLYAELRVPRGATASEIHAAYRRLARGCHPDLHPADPVAAERFRRVAAAYTVLSDPAHRAAYDRAAAGGPRAARGPPPPARPGAGVARRASPAGAGPPASGRGDAGAPPPAPSPPTDEARNLGRLALAIAIGIVLLVAAVALVAAIGPYCEGLRQPPGCAP